MAREVAPYFIAQDGGHLMNISSTSGLGGGKMSTAYSGSKFALRGMNECWRAELRPHNVRVTLVNPSEIADAIVGALEIDGRGFIPEFSVFATNPF